MRVEPLNECYLVSRNGNEFKTRKLVTFHNTNDGSEENLIWWTNQMVRSELLTCCLLF